MPSLWISYIIGSNIWKKLHCFYKSIWIDSVFRSTIILQTKNDGWVQMLTLCSNDLWKNRIEPSYLWSLIRLDVTLFHFLSWELLADHETHNKFKGITFLMNFFLDEMIFFSCSILIFYRLGLFLPGIYISCEITKRNHRNSLSYYIKAKKLLVFNSYYGNSPLGQKPHGEALTYYVYICFKDFDQRNIDAEVCDFG